MYRIEPIILINDRISLPSCMYKVKNIHGGSIFSDISTTDATEVKNSEVNQQKPLKELVMIEERQEKLLQQLEKLRNQMISMKQHFFTSSQQKVVIPPPKVLKQDSTLPKDVVIKASPANPPFYLLHLQKTLAIKIVCHTHSSVMKLSPGANDFVKKTEAANPAAHNLNIVLIWKEVLIGSQLVTSPTMPVVICGDVNIIRYLVAAIPSNLSYKHQTSSWEIDSLLDICHRLQAQTSAKERQSVVPSLNSKLGKNPWLSGPNISVADLAAWSIIKQGDYQKELTVSMKNWFKKCEDWV